jgi:hypothetical protein
MTIPSFSGKTTLAHLSDLTCLEVDSADEFSLLNASLYKKRVGEFLFDYLFQPCEYAKRLFVLFSGDAKRSKNHPPVFQRWSWASHFPGHCLYVADPSVYLDNTLGLAWYAGTDRFDPMPTIIEDVLSLASRLDISHDRIFPYGSSGGGFAALRMATMLNSVVPVAVNPQITITDYNRKGVERYLRICFENRTRSQALKEFPDRLSILTHVPKIRKRRIIYIQNILDDHHYSDHYSSFCKRMGAPRDENLEDGEFRRLLFSHEDGHRKAETPEVFNKAMDIIKTWTT